jgi:hypothetical protein
MALLRRSGSVVLLVATSLALMEIPGAAVGDSDVQSACRQLTAYAETDEFAGSDRANLRHAVALLRRSSFTGARSLAKRLDVALDAKRDNKIASAIASAELCVLALPPTTTTVPSSVRAPVDEVILRVAALYDTWNQRGRYFTPTQLSVLFSEYETIEGKISALPSQVPVAAKETARNAAARMSAGILDLSLCDSGQRRELCGIFQPTAVRDAGVSAVDALAPYADASAVSLAKTKIV